MKNTQKKETRGARKTLAVFRNYAEAECYFVQKQHSTPKLPEDEDLVEDQTLYLKECVHTKVLFLTKDYRRNSVRKAAQKLVFGVQDEARILELLQQT